MRAALPARFPVKKTMKMLLVAVNPASWGSAAMKSAVFSHLRTRGGSDGLECVGSFMLRSCAVRRAQRGLSTEESSNGFKLPDLIFCERRWDTLSRHSSIIENCPVVRDVRCCAETVVPDQGQGSCLVGVGESPTLHDLHGCFRVKPSSRQPLFLRCSQRPTGLKAILAKNLRYARWASTCFRSASSATQPSIAHFTLITNFETPCSATASPRRSSSGSPSPRA